jgi:hypothetical protein
MSWGTFDEECGGACVFAAGREALQQSREHDDQRCRNPDGGIGRRECDHRDCHRHQADDQCQRSFAAFAIGGAAFTGPGRVWAKALPCSRGLSWARS